MAYIVLEIQSNNGHVATIVNDYVDKNQAESKFHQILTAAAISTVPVHSAVLLTDTGRTMKDETYIHENE